MTICNDCYLTKWTTCPIQEILLKNAKAVKPKNCMFKEQIKKACLCERDAMGRKAS